MTLAAVPATADEPSSLVEAAERQDWPTVQRLLIEGSDLDRKQVDGMTALHWAVQHGNQLSVQRLLVAGADPNAATRYEITPLAIASEQGDGELVRLLLVAGADPNKPVAGRVSPLLLASQSGDLESVRHLLRAGAKVNASERRGTTPLMWAAASGHTKVIDALVEAGADMNKSTWAGFNALMFAARQGQLDAVDRLVEAGADVHTVTGDKRRGGERGPRPHTSALLMAVESAHYEVALRLVDLGADPNDQRSGYAPLHALSWVRRPQYGDNAAGDPPPRGSGSVTPLRFVRDMVQRGADPNLRLEQGRSAKAELNPKGATPLVMASMTADLPLMQTLLEVGGDPTIATADNTTTLMAAAGIGAKSVGEHPGTEPEVLAAIAWLVEQGVEINAINEHHQTAMHGAAYRNYPRAVTLLAELGADPAVWNVKNHHGSTPIQIAQGKRPGSLKPSPETVEALRAAKSQKDPGSSDIARPTIN